ncbi:MAG: DUF1579 domain-containing protein [Chitinophagaceae bacterium]
MKRITLMICAAAFLVAACNNAKKTDESKTESSSSDTAAKTADNTPMPDSATMMKNWQANMTPGEMHAMLAKSTGTWTADITMWQAPGAPASKSTGTAVNKMLFGGRYQESTNTSTMMGMPFEGRSVTGYDNAKQVFVSNWVDNMGTGMMNMEGPWDPGTKTINFKGRMIDPMTMKECDYRETFQIVDDDNQVMQMFGPGPDGKEFKTMEINFKRKK